LNDAYQKIAGVRLVRKRSAIRSLGADTWFIHRGRIPTINRHQLLKADGARFRIDDVKRWAFGLSNSGRNVPCCFPNPTLSAKKDANAIAQAITTTPQIAARVQAQGYQGATRTASIWFSKKSLQGESVESRTSGSFVGGTRVSFFRPASAAVSLGTKQARPFPSTELKRDTFVPENASKLDPPVAGDFLSVARLMSIYGIAAANAQLTQERDGYFSTDSMSKRAAVSVGPTHPSPRQSMGVMRMITVMWSKPSRCRLFSVAGCGNRTRADGTPKAIRDGVRLPPCRTLYHPQRNRDSHVECGQYRIHGSAVFLFKRIDMNGKHHHA